MKQAGQGEKKHGSHENKMGVIALGLTSPLNPPVI
jgi:hypothetical protein